MLDFLQFVSANVLELPHTCLAAKIQICIIYFVQHVTKSSN